jgi:fucose permease
MTWAAFMALIIVGSAVHPYAQHYSPDNFGFINVFEVTWPAAALVLLVRYVRALSPSARSATA